MATKARQQYFADENSLQKQRREFSIADDIQQKIDSIEEGAQVNVIETVKVNGTPLIPDANKAVNVEVPEVIDNLYTIDSDNALSAKQGKILYDYIQNIASRGRFLSNWNSATGLPMTNPSESPYSYKSGDYFVVSNVAASGGTNYRPDGSSYIIGQASTVVETEDVSVSDFYFYDGTNWLLLSNSGRQIAIDSSLSTTSTNPVENRVITNALNNKQDVLTAGNHIDITSNVVSTTGLQEELTAGENITIEDICTTESDMKGPCPSGFHVPLWTEWVNAWNIRRALGGASWDGGAFSAAFKLPFPGYRNPWRGQQSNVGNGGMYWSSSASGDKSFNIEIGPSSLNATSQRYRGQALSVRPFKNTPTAPDNTRTKLYGTSIEGGGIFWSSADELISFSSDGTTRYTMADKNLGATTVRNSGDVLSEVNGGYYYQWGNNYGFSRGSITTSSTKVDASNYGPANPYSSNIFISGLIDADWSSVQNDNLRGGVTQGTYQDCDLIISATDTTYTAGTGINIDANNVISSTITPGQTYTAGNGINIDSNNEISVDTSVVATQTDLQNGLDEKQGLLTAGENITIEDVCTTESDMKGPCPSGFHIETDTERQSIYDIGVALGARGSSLTRYSISRELKMPLGGNISRNNISNQGSAGRYRHSTTNQNGIPYNFRLASTFRVADTYLEANQAAFIRPIKNTSIAPDGSWTMTFDGSSVATGAGIFHNATLGLISLSSDGNTWYTITDKNLGATTVWNDGDALSEANCGNSYQWGNNYGFSYVIPQPVTTVEIQDLSLYGPGNYYSNNKFYNGNDGWGVLNNKNLRGGVSQGTFQDCIHNVISATDTTYTAGTGINIDSNNEISNTLPGAIVSATAPSSPTEGMVWYDTTNDALKAYNGTSWETEGTKMVVLSYGHSTWQDFIDAYEKNAIVYCKASSQSNPGSGTQGRMAFMAFIDINSTTGDIQGVEFQYYRSRSSHSTAATVLDEVYVYKLVPSNGGTWSVTQRDTAAEPIAGTGIGLTYNASGMTIANTGVTSVNNQTGSVTVLESQAKVFPMPEVGDNISDLVSWLSAGKVAVLTDSQGHNYSISYWLGEEDEMVCVGYDQSSAKFVVVYIPYTTPGYIVDTIQIGRQGLVPTGGTAGQVLTQRSNGIPNWQNPTGTTYEAGDGIIIGEKHRDSQGPCPSGYHIPSMSELDDLMLVWNTLFQGSSVLNPSMSEYFKMPLAGHREDNWDFPAEWVATAVNTGGTYRSSYAYGMLDACGLSLTATGQTVVKKESPYWTAIPPQSGCFIRPLRDTPIAADETWTMLYDGSSVATGAGIFHSPSEGIISISADGTNWITIADKNVGATTVWNLGDTLSESNTGNTFQRGNNYAFPSTLGSLQGLTVSVNRVDASGYGPGNYYSDDTIILPGSETGEDGWDSSENTLLWGGESTGIRVSNGSGNTIASKNGVLVFDAPQVGDDISDMINYLSGGGGALIKGSNGLYYTVTEYGGMTLWGRAFHRTINLLPTYNYIEIWHDGGIVSSIEYRQTDLLVNPPGQNGQILTKTSTGSNKWTTPSIIISDQANNILQNGTTLWCGSEGDYANLGTYSSGCIYLTVPGGASPQFTPSSETPIYLPLSHSYINYGYSGNAVSYGTASFEEKDGADCLLLNPGYLEVDTSNSTIFSHRRTLNFWVNCTSITSPQATFVGKGNGNAEATLSLYVDTSSGKLMLNNADETKQYSTLSANTWYNIVVTHNASTDETKVYINSTLISTDTLNLSPKDNVLKIGETWNGQSGSKFYISRFILQSGIWTAQNVTNDYNGAKGYYGIS